MLHDLIEKLSNHPGFFLFCRSLLEANFVAIRRTIRASLPLAPDHKLLDLACGPGAFARMFPAGTYFGIDINDQYIRYARAKHPGTFETMDARQLRFANASFDAALVFGLLHHLSDADAAQVIAELHRVMKPGGCVLIMEDIPTRSRLNVVGRLIHGIENGHHIRPPEQYRALLARHFTFTDEKTFLSGVCDYYAATLAPLPATRPALV
ncbi:MAG: class I SAM-dependent methyltransferase [Planctomycetota bacterium]